ncbi:hypothetical protein D9613_008287 [Agrocybe pediades]|uniref:Uncharacterized protein n=1 Tax=Agrocybe pediades TaxID=84607 RepID=A0A8H4QSM4_9AGAR|nr:hypothetical protein D9613_008287 [Agrocybe pediades]
MTSLRRVPKSGKDWTLYDLDAYHVDMRWQDHHTFFGVTSLPNPQVDTELLEANEAADMVEPRNAEFIHLMHLAMLHHTTQASPPQPISSSSCSKGWATSADTGSRAWEGHAAPCVRRVPQCDSGREDRRRELNLSLEGDQGEAVAIAAGGASPEAELIAAAIAAFVQNNVNRQYAGLPELTNTVIPGIIIAGTSLHLQDSYG